MRVVNVRSGKKERREGQKNKKRKKRVKKNIFSSFFGEKFNTEFVQHISTQTMLFFFNIIYIYMHKEHFILNV